MDVPRCKEDISYARVGVFFGLMSVGGRRTCLSTAASGCAVAAGDSCDGQSSAWDVFKRVRRVVERYAQNSGRRGLAGGCDLGDGVTPRSGSVPRASQG